MPVVLGYILLSASVPQTKGALFSSGAPGKLPGVAFIVLVKSQALLWSNHCIKKDGGFYWLGLCYVPTAQPRCEVSFPNRMWTEYGAEIVLQRAAGQIEGDDSHRMRSFVGISCSSRHDQVYAKGSSCRYPVVMNISYLRTCMKNPPPRVPTIPCSDGRCRKQGWVSINR